MAFEDNKAGKGKRFCQSCGLKLATGWFESFFRDPGHEFESGMYCKACGKTRHDIDVAKLAADTRRRAGVRKQAPVKDERKKPPPSFDILGGGGQGF